MDDRVGDSVPTAKQVDKWKAEIDRLKKEIEPYTIHLDTEARKHLLRFRPGGERVASLAAELGEQKKLEIPGVSGERIRADLELAARLQPLATALATLSERVDDTSLEAQAEAWWGTTAYYTALQGLARSDGALQKALEPIKEFFATGRRKPRGPASDNR
jgi:hypothetical protein